MAAAAGTYHGYEPLDENKSQVRLLKTWKSQDAHVIHASLELASLQDIREHRASEYYALSWC